ncbi:hypothetical protein KSP40_PGU007208 [Platanthera guangdongensis]|uniref:BRCT domain-containing protein n=1 Tax=Platanthera guangdongensis TaxID=2320717 RepID=A0ABR2LTP0_9ASPA
MACSEYHSPQFAEDPAWLPAWLQPYEQTNIGFEGQNHGDATPACQSLQENLCKGGITQLTTSGGAKYTSCNLHLSGDDYQQVGRASFSNAMHFNLHLSSTNSQFWSVQSNEIPDLRRHDMNKCSSSQKSVSENQVITHSLACQHTFEDPAPRMDSAPTVFKQNVSYKPNKDQFIIANNNSHQECDGKLDVGGQECTTVDDVIELSIAASEALVISEVMFSSMHFDSFSDATILEIALRVKHARKGCILEKTHAFSTGDPDDSDHLSDLDENSMFDAFEDVGITVQQFVETSNDPFACRKSSKTALGSDIRHQEIFKSDSSFHNIFVVHNGHEREADAEMIKGADTYKTSSQGSLLEYKLQLNSIQVKSHSQNKIDLLDNLPLDYSIQCLEDNSPEHEQKLHIIDAWPPNQTGSMEHQCIKEVGKVSKLSNAKIKERMKLFTWETSFLSESMDDLDKDASQRKPSAELEIVSSSDTALEVKSSALCKEKEHNHDTSLSQDYYGNLLLADPLCSIVPCSISSGITVGHESKLGVDLIEKSKNSMTVIYSKCLDENSTMQSSYMLHKPFVGNRDILSGAKFEQPCVSNRKQLNSLKPYSLATDAHKMDIVLPGKSRFSDNSNTEQILEQNKIRVPYLAFGVIESDDTRPPAHGDACSPPVLNCMNPFEGFQVTTCSGTNDNRKSSSISDLGKCRSNVSTRKASYRNGVINRSLIRAESDLHSFPADKKLMKKRVRFQEATFNIGPPKTYLAQRSCSGTTEPLQNSNLLHKSEFGRDQNINYLITNSTVSDNAMILQGLDFLLTGFSSCNAKNLEELIRRHGGYVLQNIPSFSPNLRWKLISSVTRKLPVVLCPKKVQTTKFLYGCAVNTFVLNYHWLEDSIQSGTIRPPGKYMIRSFSHPKENKLIIRLNNGSPILNKVGMMVHGKAKFCAKFMKIVKHGGGQVFKSLHRLVQSLKNGTNTLGIILVKNESCVSRHLKHCALEHGIPTMPASWIITSLFSGKLLPPKRDPCAPFHRIKMPSFPAPQPDGMSQEI